MDPLSLLFGVGMGLLTAAAIYAGCDRGERRELSLMVEDLDADELRGLAHVLRAEAEAVEERARRLMYEK